MTSKSDRLNVPQEAKIELKMTSEQVATLKKGVFNSGFFDLEKGVIRATNMDSVAYKKYAVEKQKERDAKKQVIKDKKAERRQAIKESKEKLKTQVKEARKAVRAAQSTGKLRKLEERKARLREQAKKLGLKVE